MSVTTNPYVGPRSYETGEVLYGRDRELRALKALLIAERIVLLHSPSGAGKTSLVRAGLLPQLKEDDFSILPVVRVNVEPPVGVQVNRYLLSTLVTLEEAFPAEERLSLQKLASLNLADYLDLRAPQKDTLLVFDQFEEVLTTAPSDREGKQVFFNEIGAALRNKKRWALFSMREDFLGALAPYLRPIPNRLVTRFRLDLLGAEAASQAVEKPAKAAGVIFNPDATKKLIDDLRRVQVQLPDGSMETQLGLYVEPVQLQVVCYRLWEKKNENDQSISLKDLEKVGDVNESLAGYYALSISRVAETSGSSERVIREWFERKLITVDGIRGQVRMGAELSDGLPNPAVRLLENTHIIRAEQRAGQTWFELAHDRLIEPVRANNADWFDRNLSLFQRQANLWLDQGRSEGLLLRGRELEQAELEIKQVKPTVDEEAFLQACRLRRKREKRDQTQRRMILVGLFASLILFIVAVFSSLNATQANAGLQTAIARANSASTQAIDQQIAAEAARNEAYNQRATAYALATDAFNSQATAEKARNDAIASANNASTQQAQALIQRSKAMEQEQFAKDQSKLAQAISLVAQALLAESQLDEKTANLMAAAAFEILDNARTRTRLLVSLANKNLLYMEQTPVSGQTIEMSFAAGGTKLVTTNYFDCLKNDIYLCGNGVVKIWKVIDTTNSRGFSDATLQQENAQIRPPGGSLDSSTVSPDGNTIATATCNPVNNNLTRCEQEIVNFWDVGTLKKSDQTLVLTDNIFNQQAVKTLYSPDGSLLALSYNNPTSFNPATTNSPTLVIWDLKTLKEKARVGTDIGMTQMAFSPDGKTLAYVSGKNLVLVEIATLEKKKLVSPIDPNHNLLSLAYSPDGGTLAVGDDEGLIGLLETKTYQKTNILVYNSKVLALHYSPDNLVLVSGHYNAGIIYWDVKSGTRLLKKPLFNHFNPDTPDDFPIYALAFSPDGLKLASSSNEIILWDMKEESWLAKACDIAGRNFSTIEWSQNFPGEAYRLTCPTWPAGK